MDMVSLYWLQSKPVKTRTCSEKLTGKIFTFILHIFSVPITINEKMFTGRRKKWKKSSQWSFYPVFLHNWLNVSLVFGHPAHVRYVYMNSLLSLLKMPKSFTCLLTQRAQIRNWTVCFRSELNAKKLKSRKV